MGKSFSKHLTSTSYPETSYKTTSLPTPKRSYSKSSSKPSSKPSSISVNSRSNSFIKKRISSFSVKSSSKWSLTSASIPKNIPTPNSILASMTPNTPGTPCTFRNTFTDSSSDYFSNSLGINNDNNQYSEYKFIDGRRYHNIDSVKYPLPNDELEMDRLKAQHYLFRHVFQNNFSSPVEEILKIGGTEVLDLGCGPGAWLSDMAEAFPKSNFTGVDLTNTLTGNDSLQNDLSENIKFVEGNVLEGLPFKNSTFDFVFMRHLSYGFTEQDWMSVINEVLRVTKPGGWIELMEPELKTHNDGPITVYLNDAFIKDLESQNICINITTKLEQILLNTKQINQVYHDEKFVNGGSWAGRFGELACENFMIIIRTIKSRLSQIIGVNNEEYDQLLQNIPEEMNEFKSSFVNHRFWAQKLFPI